MFSLKFIILLFFQSIKFYYISVQKDREGEMRSGDSSLVAWDTFCRSPRGASHMRLRWEGPQLEKRRKS